MKWSPPLSVPAFLFLLLVIPGMAGAQTSPPPKPQPQIAFEAAAVVATGLTPGEKVVWLGVERLVDADLSAEIVRRHHVKTAGADGVSRLEVGRPVGQRSVWVAVDLKSGELAVAAPEGYEVVRRGRPARLGAGPGDQPDEILDDGPSYLYGLVVRPGEGAWTFAGGDGGAQDEDGESNGRVRFALDKLDPLPGSPAPPVKTQGADLWIVVDLLNMQVSLHRGGVAR